MTCSSKRPPRLPAHLTHVAVDCGSYTLAQHQVQPGFHFTAEQYVAWIRALGPAVRWAVLPDWPCERANASEVRRRQIATTVTAVEVLSNHLDVPWCWCPVLQGQRVEDYLRHAIDVAAWVYELHDSHDGSFVMPSGKDCGPTFIPAAIPARTHEIEETGVQASASDTDEATTIDEDAEPRSKTWACQTTSRTNTPRGRAPASAAGQRRVPRGGGRTRVPKLEQALTRS